MSLRYSNRSLVQVLSVQAGAFALAWASAACIGVERPAVSSMQEVIDSPPGKDVPFEESLTEGAALAAGSVKVSLEQKFQTLEGFGASVGWHQDRIAGVVPDGLYEFLFPELGLDIIRFRNRFERTDKSDERLQQEVTIYKRGTEALGYAPRLMLSSWSPPARYKASGREKCQGNSDCTLKKESGQFVYEGFADWWKRSVEHYRGLGLNPHWISIQNEPDFVPPDWEGCKFTAVEQADYPGYGKALAAVHAAVQKLPDPPRLLGPEVLGIHYERVQKYLAGMDENLVAGINHHIYERGDDAMWDWRDPGPDSFLDEMEAVQQATKKPTFQTEFNTDEDRGVDGGFETAWLIHHSLVTQGASAFLYWELIWPNSKGLVAMKGLTPSPRDHYYSLRHFARYTDPGYVRVGADATGVGLLASAYLAPDGGRLTLVLLNTSLAAMETSIDRGAFEGDKSQAFVTGYRPGASRRWNELGALTNGKLRLPARSVATLVFER
jgi:glucuronoarabinoxylan endo-1,4-beta-xylanase